MTSEEKLREYLKQAMVDLRETRERVREMDAELEDSS